MRDADVRLVLKQHLVTMFEVEANTIVIEELGLCRGSVRADIVVINGSLRGYEIKSDRDTLTRLANQAEAYCRVFDTVTIVVAERHLKRAAQIVPGWWGIDLVVADTLSALHLCRVRPECHNTEVDPSALVQLLWHDEALALLNRISPSEHFADQPRRFLWQALAAAVTVCELKDLVRECLKSRKRWRVPEEQTQGDVRFQPCAKSSGSMYRRVHLRSRRYIYRPS